VETIIIIGLAIGFLWTGWKLHSLRAGLRVLTDLLRREGDPTSRDLPQRFGDKVLADLKNAVFDSVSEAGLGKASAQRKTIYLEALLNEIKDAIFILDQNREIRFLNQAARLLFPSELPYSARQFIEVCRDHRIYDTLDLAEEIGSKVSDRIMLRAEGTTRDRIREINLLVEAEPLNISAGGEPVGSWILMRDITNELETEQIRRDFVANASHELRTPLSIINGYLETMDEEDEDLNQPLFRRAVKTMRKHGGRIARIIDDMLTISKLENSHDLLNREPFELGDSLEEITTQLQPMIEQNHARVIIENNSRESWVLYGDRFYWDQIFFNLIENALKQNREPGLRITVRFTYEAGRYVISITDDGIGIPAADIPLIFKRFYRVQKHHAKTQVSGTGLGLSIVKRAVEAHHGTIRVSSQPGVATTFTISVPETGISQPPRPSNSVGEGN
jgi:two-component system, OmpR family, phosphate regulon sensor histidine kinase PhoR